MRKILLLLLLCSMILSYKTQALTLNIDAYHFTTIGYTDSPWLGVDLTFKQELGRFYVKHTLSTVSLDRSLKYVPVDSYYETVIGTNINGWNIYWKHTCWHAFYYPRVEYETLAPQEMFGISREFTLI